jgi:hypothetical protein
LTPDQSLWNSDIPISARFAIYINKYSHCIFPFPLYSHSHHIPILSPNIPIAVVNLSTTALGTLCGMPVPGPRRRPLRSHRGWRASHRIEPGVQRENGGIPR